MKRVTYWDDEYRCRSYHCSSGDAAKLLAAYYDTGLEPEKVAAISQAEKDGRLVVLPEASERDRKSFINGLQDYFQDASL